MKFSWNGNPDEFSFSILKKIWYGLLYRTFRSSKYLFFSIEMRFWEPQKNADFRCWKTIPTFLLCFFSLSKITSKFLNKLKLLVLIHPHVNSNRNWIFNSYNALLEQHLLKSHILVYINGCVWWKYTFVKNIISLA